MPWDPLHGWDAKHLEFKTNGLESIKDCGFNFAGFVLPPDLKQCRKLGLAAIVLPTDDPIRPSDDRKHWRHLSDAEIEARIKEMTASAGSNPAAMGFFIMDEPSVADFPALAKAVAAVKKHAPGKLAYINLFPGYATLGAADMSQLGTTNYTEYLDRFVNEVHPQLLSYDNYTVQYSDDLKKPAIGASYFRNLLEVRRIGQKYHLPFVQIVAANQLRPFHPIPSAANLALQAYTTLAAGYRGVTWYTYFGRGYKYSPIDGSGLKTPTWDYVRVVNRHVAALAPTLRHLRSTGIFFTEPPIASGLPILPGNLITGIKSASPMMAGEFDGLDGSYVMLVNLSLDRSCNFTFTLRQSSDHPQEISPMDGKLRAFLPGKDGYWLPAGEALLLRLRGT